MRHDFLDKFSRLDSPIHRLPAGSKLGLAMAGILATVIVPLTQPWFFLLLLLLLATTTVLGRIPPSFVLGRLVLLEPLVAGIAILSVLQPNGGLAALSIVVKSTLCLTTMILLTNTTPFADILGVLRSLRVPALLITVLALMYRYLFVLIDEAERMRRARLSRTFSTRRDRLWKSSAALIGQLFVRSSERAERIYAAMSARGWR
jgi:cobalt/nickel transport system permease protein